ncbi:MAG: hypothetical protein ACRC62_16770 [Microcoleus sp.]
MLLELVPGSIEPNYWLSLLECRLEARSVCLELLWKTPDAGPDRTITVIFECDELPHRASNECESQRTFGKVTSNAPDFLTVTLAKCVPAYFSDCIRYSGAVRVFYFSA